MGPFDGGSHEPHPERAPRSQSRSHHRRAGRASARRRRGRRGRRRGRRRARRHRVRSSRHADRRRRRRGGGRRRRKAVAERIDPTGEIDYWREAHRSREYVKPDRDFERDYRPAYEYGIDARERHRDRDWQEVERDLGSQWPHARATSQLDWDDARHAARDAWERTDRTYRTYGAGDRYFASRFEHSPYRSSEESFDDYRPAYRYGMQARSRYGERDWDDRLEAELREGWERIKGGSRLTWERAKHAVREAFHTREDEYPGAEWTETGLGAPTTGTTRSGLGPGTDRGF